MLIIIPTVRKIQITRVFLGVRARRARIKILFLHFKIISSPKKLMKEEQARRQAAKNLIFPIFLLLVMIQFRLKTLCPAP